MVLKLKRLKLTVVYNDHEDKKYHTTARIAIPPTLLFWNKQQQQNKNIIKKFVTSYNERMKQDDKKNVLDPDCLHLALLKDDGSDDEGYFAIPSDVPVTTWITTNTSKNDTKTKKVYIRPGKEQTQKDIILALAQTKSDEDSSAAVPSDKPVHHHCARYGCGNVYVDGAKKKKFSPCLFHNGAPKSKDDEKPLYYWSCCPTKMANTFDKLQTIPGCQHSSTCLLLENINHNSHNTNYNEQEVKLLHSQDEDATLNNNGELQDKQHQDVEESNEEHKDASEEKEAKACTAGIMVEKEQHETVQEGADEKHRTGEEENKNNDEILDDDERKKRMDDQAPDCLGREPQEQTSMLEHARSKGALLGDQDDDGDELDDLNLRFQDEDVVAVCDVAHTPKNAKTLLQGIAAPGHSLSSFGNELRKSMKETFFIDVCDPLEGEDIILTDDAKNVTDSNIVPSCPTSCSDLQKSIENINIQKSVKDALFIDVYDPLEGEDNIVATYCTDTKTIIEKGVQSLASSCTTSISGLQKSIDSLNVRKTMKEALLVDVYDPLEGEDIMLLSTDIPKIDTSSFSSLQKSIKNVLFIDDCEPVAE